MSLIPQKRTAPEILDLAPGGYRLEELERTLADLRAVNRYLGDLPALLKHLAIATAGLSSFTVLDVATGSGDMPVAIAAWAKRHGIAASITGVDINPHSIEIARTQTAAYPEITLRVADGLNLPFPDRSFDFVICSKTAHHLADPDAVRLLGEMLRVARRGYLLMDLRRSWIAYALISVLTRIFTRNRLTRYDAPLSVLKSFTASELNGIACSAGASRFWISREPFWLLVLAGELP
jgi:SAM-dependent methyltransferase